VKILLRILVGLIVLVLGLSALVGLSILIDKVSNIYNISQYYWYGLAFILVIALIVQCHEFGKEIIG
jgi:hypothetical protein